MSDGWDESATAWIDSLEDAGDWARRRVLDTPMLARIEGRGFGSAIDVGCGEGRFCRMLQSLGIRVTGIDPTVALVEEARRRDPDGDYRIGRAEALDVASESFDLAVSYLSLIDIPDLHAAIAEAHRVLRPGGTFLIANLQSFNTAGPPTGWTKEADGTRRFYIDNYLDEKAEWVAWRGVRVLNWHRPLGTYMRALLNAGFSLTHFAEPEPSGPDDETAQRYWRVPWFLMMEWQKAG